MSDSIQYIFLLSHLDGAQHHAVPNEALHGHVRRCNRPITTLLSLALVLSYKPARYDMVATAHYRAWERACVSQVYDVSRDRFLRDRSVRLTQMVMF